MPESQAWIDTRPDGLVLTLNLPLNRLVFAVGPVLQRPPDAVLPALAEPLSRYLLAHVGARSGAAGWRVERPALAIAGAGDTAELVARLVLTAPAGADPRRVTLLLDAITHEVRTHRVQVFLRSDWQGGWAGRPPRLLGTLDTAHATLALDLAPAGPLASVVSLGWEGVLHILAGADHLLFLALLLWVAPLATPAPGAGWGAVRPARGAARHTVGVVTAFTLGHTLTLVLGSTGVLQVPAGPVEVGVALSIVLAAVHAWRPLWRGGELGLAAGLGTLHGLAFSASLSPAGLTPGQHALALLAFNLGIEAVQLVALAVFGPLLWALQRTRPGPAARARRGFSAVAAVVALAWVWERTLAVWGTAPAG